MADRRVGRDQFELKVTDRRRRGAIYSGINHIRRKTSVNLHSKAVKVWKTGNPSPCWAERYPKRRSHLRHSASEPCVRVSISHGSSVIGSLSLVPVTISLTSVV